MTNEARTGTGRNVHASLTPAASDRPTVDRRSSRLLYDESGYLLTRHDEQGTVGSASPAVQALLGQAPWQIEGRRWHQFVHPDDGAAFGRWWGSISQGSGSTHTYRLQARAADGTVTTVETLARKMSVGKTQVTEIHALTRDVTGEADRTEDLVREHGQLERRFDTLVLHDLAVTRSRPMPPTICGLPCRRSPGSPNSWPGGKGRRSTRPHSGSWL